jgi:exodeoxyribonuclease VII large subunit
MTLLERYVQLPRIQVERLEERLVLAQRNSLNQLKQRLVSQFRLLSSFNPTATLKRGYAIVRSGERVITGPEQVSAGSTLVIQLAEGNIRATTDDE